MLSRTLKYKEVYNQLKYSLSDYINKNNLAAMILGISGGLDSTVVAAIAKQVSEEINVPLIGISMPSNTNNSSENEIAKQVCKAFCSSYIEYNIQNEYNTLLTSLENITKNYKGPHYNGISKISKGNIKARIRMIFLYHMASEIKGIVLDTDNKSERNLGFYTINGDVGDITPLADLYKTEVYELAEFLKDYIYINNEYCWNALNNAIDAIPTDGNGVSPGGDMGQICPGYTYEEVDLILDEYLNNNPNNMLIDNFADYFNHKYPYITKQAVIEVLNRHKNSEFKRNLPIRFHI